MHVDLITFSDGTAKQQWLNEQRGKKPTERKLSIQFVETNDQSEILKEN